MKRILGNLKRLEKSKKPSNGLSVKINNGKVQVKGIKDKAYTTLALFSDGTVKCNKTTFKIDLKAVKPFTSFREGLIKAGLKGITSTSSATITLDG